MKDHETSGNNSPLADDTSEITENIETYLNNHTREGAHAYMHNMAARRETWHPLHVSSEEPKASGHQTDAQ